MRDTVWNLRHGDPHLGMPCIAALISDVAERERVRVQLHALGRITFFAGTRDLIRHASGTAPIDLVLSDLRDQSAMSVRPALHALAGSRPAVPLIVYVSPSSSDVRDLMSLIGDGVRAEYALRSALHLHDVAAALVHDPSARSAATTLLAQLLPPAPRAARAYVLACAVGARGGVRVQTIARWLGMSPRALQQRLAHAALPPAHVLLGRACGLHAVWWLEVHGWPLKRVASHLGFAGTMALSRTLRRYWRTSATALVEAGGFPVMLARCEQTLGAAASDTC